jgi:hypothetical protein
MNLPAIGQGEILVCLAVGDVIMIVEERSPIIFALAIDQVSKLWGLSPKATIAHYAQGIDSRQDLGKRSRTAILHKLEDAYEQGQQVLAAGRLVRR